MYMRTRNKRYQRPALPVNYKSIKDNKFSFNADSLTVSGYLSIFNVVDSDGDLIVKGAYAKSISERGPDSSTHRKIAFLWQHDMADPIGRITVLKEDNVGLYFEAILSDPEAVPSAKRAYTQLNDKTLDQFSVGYAYVWDKMEYDEAMDAFVCKEINLFEGSVVTLGANEYTFFDGMKSTQMKDAKTKLLKETESFIKSLPTEQQYACRQLIMKNVQMALVARRKEIDAGDDGADGTSDDPNLDFIHKCLPLHGKAIDMINDHEDDVDNDELQDCMKEFKDMHTDCMGKLCDIKDSITGDEKSLREPRSQKALPGKPIKDLDAVLAETNFF
jgi:uncharacterized protein